LAAGRGATNSLVAPDYSNKIFERLAGENIMPQSLSTAAVGDFKRDGYYFPVPVLSRTEVERFRSALEAHEAKSGEPLQGNMRHKAWGGAPARRPK
jgi:hypothetical protein